MNNKLIELDGWGLCVLQFGFIACWTGQNPLKEHRFELRVQILYVIREKNPLSFLKNQMKLHTN